MGWWPFFFLFSLLLPPRYDSRFSLGREVVLTLVLSRRSESAVGTEAELPLFPLAFRHPQSIVLEPTSSTTRRTKHTKPDHV